MTLLSFWVGSCQACKLHLKRNVQASQADVPEVQVDVWDHARSQPISSFQWGAESALSARFNPVRFSMQALPMASESAVMTGLAFCVPISHERPVGVLMMHFHCSK